MTFHLITIFPEIFDSYLKEGILRRAQAADKVKVKVYNLRDFATDKHKTVDDTPYGGGPGMVLKVEPIFRCLEKIKEEIEAGEDAEVLQEKDAERKGNSHFQIPKTLVLLTSAKGKQFSQFKAEELKKYEHIVIICGRYEGVDERVAQHLVDEEISVGRYILTGGELPALIVADAVTRLLPGVLGNEESLNSESYNQKDELDYPTYTKPENFQHWKVPPVLLSGDHAKIAKWREDKKDK